MAGDSPRRGTAAQQGTRSQDAGVRINDLMGRVQYPLRRAADRRGPAAAISCGDRSWRIEDIAFHGAPIAEASSETRTPRRDSCGAVGSRRILLDEPKTALHRLRTSMSKDWR